MEYRTLGRTKVRVSEIGFGAWGIGGAMWKSEDSDSFAALKAALVNGVNFFDTAFVYGDGHSENLVAEAREKYGALLPKSSPPFAVATKVPPMNGEWPARAIPIGQVFPEDYIIKMAKKSWENLGGRKIDLLQLHVWNDKWIDEPGWRNAFRKLKAEGIADFFGVSINDHAPETALKIVRSGEIDSVQVIYNMFDQSPEDELFDACVENDVGVIARVPLDEGSLAGKFTADTRFDDWRKRYFAPNRMPEVVKRVDGLRWLEKPGRTLVQAALEFCLSNKAVSTVIPGMRKAERVAENCAVAGKRLTGEELEKIKGHRWDRNFYR
jgi:aryl-alcohol dehydrogenase-like predicted oxidoreductase